jgi:hypothetical protein
MRSRCRRAATGRWAGGGRRLGGRGRRGIRGAWRRRRGGRGRHGPWLSEPTREASVSCSRPSCTTAPHTPRAPPRDQAAECGDQIRRLLDAAYGDAPYKLHFVTSPYTRSRQTFVGIRHAFNESQIAGVNEAVQLREQVRRGRGAGQRPESALPHLWPGTRARSAPAQHPCARPPPHCARPPPHPPAASARHPHQDFGNFQIPDKMENDQKERNRFGRCGRRGCGRARVYRGASEAAGTVAQRRYNRSETPCTPRHPPLSFYYRFPDGESTADVYDRVSILEDNLLRDIRAVGFFGGAGQQRCCGPECGGLVPRAPWGPARAETQAVRAAEGPASSDPGPRTPPLVPPGRVWRQLHDLRDLPRPHAARVHDALVQLERGAVPADLQPPKRGAGEFGAGGAGGLGRRRPLATPAHPNG